MDLQRQLENLGFVEKKHNYKGKIPVYVDTTCRQFQLFVVLNYEEQKVDQVPSRDEVRSFGSDQKEKDTRSTIDEQDLDEKVVISLQSFIQRFNTIESFKTSEKCCNALEALDVYMKYKYEDSGLNPICYSFDIEKIQMHIFVYLFDNTHLGFEDTIKVLLQFVEPPDYVLYQADTDGFNQEIDKALQSAFMKSIYYFWRYQHQPENYSGLNLRF